MRASGPSGVLRVGYQWAGELGAWALEVEAKVPRSIRVRAKLLREHGYWVTQRPLDLVLHLASVAWIWRDIAFQREDGYLVTSVQEKPIVESVSQSPLAWHKEGVN